MRFCVECGNNLQAAQPAAQPAYSPPAQAAAPAQPAYAQQPAYSPAPAQASPEPQRLSRALGGPVCPRCRGVGDSGAEFCKFCGARYNEQAAPAQQPAYSPPAQQPAYSPPAQQPAHAPAVAHQPTVQQERSASRGQLVSILKDGSDGEVFQLTGEQTDVGRTEGDIVLPDDPYLAPRHARVRAGADGCFLRNLDSFNGVYVRLRGPVPLESGDVILIGQQVLRFETLSDAELPLGPANVHGVMVFGTPEVPRYGRLVQYTTEGVGRDVHYLYRDETVLGRENGDIVFTDDPFLSRRHASITVERAAGRYTLKDLGSSNGTAIRIRGEHRLTPGDQFRIGRHLFRFDDHGSGGGHP